MQVPLTKEAREEIRKRFSDWMRVGADDERHYSEIARIVGVNRSTISRWVTGRTLIKKDHDALQIEKATRFSSPKEFIDANKESLHQTAADSLPDQSSIKDAKTPLSRAEGLILGGKPLEAIEYFCLASELAFKSNNAELGWRALGKAVHAARVTGSLQGYGLVTSIFLPRLLTFNIKSYSAEELLAFGNFAVENTNYLTNQGELDYFWIWVESSKKYLHWLGLRDLLNASQKKELESLRIRNLREWASPQTRRCMNQDKKLFERSRDLTRELLDSSKKVDSGFVGMQIINTTIGELALAVEDYRQRYSERDRLKGETLLRKCEGMIGLKMQAWEFSQIPKPFEVWTSIHLYVLWAEICKLVKEKREFVGAALGLSQWTETKFVSTNKIRLESTLPFLTKDFFRGKLDRRTLVYKQLFEGTRQIQDFSNRITK